MWTRVAAAVVAYTVLAASPAAMQQLPDASLRAAFLFNFARYTEWPAAALAPAATLTICTDDAAVFAALKDAVVGKSINDHPLAARQISGTETKGCHVAYLRRLPVADARRLAPGLAASNVLSVVDSADVLHAGAVAQFFIEDRRLRFAVHLPHATNAGLQMSSRLLSLAVIIKGPHAETPR